MQSGFVTVYGNMKWFRVAEQPKYLDLLPTKIVQAKNLWDTGKEVNSPAVIELVEPFVGGLFVADNLEGWRGLLKEETFGEFEASSIRLVGVDFSSSPIPLCKVEGWFDLPLKDGVSRSDFERWIDRDHQGELFSGISFYWNFSAPELEDLDLTVGDHLGAEALVIAEA
jgi:hypothetical protein